MKWCNQCPQQKMEIVNVWLFLVTTVNNRGHLSPTIGQVQGDPKQYYVHQLYNTTSKTGHINVQITFKINKL